MDAIKLKKQREFRSKNGNAITKKYEKSINGFLMRVYRNMKSRVNGVTKNKNHLYLGKQILDRNIFYEWSKNNKSFIHLFEEWKISNYERRKTPSIDRIDTTGGYILNNIQWITFSENCRRGAFSKHGKIY